MFNTIVTIEGVLFLLSVPLFIWLWLAPSERPPKLPSATSTWPILGLFYSLTSGKKVLSDVYLKQLSDNKPYALRGILGNSILLPLSMLRWLISQPESHLSAKWAQMDALNIPMTFLRPDIGLNPVHEPLIRRDLTANLDRIAGHIGDEVGIVLQELWGKNTESWRQVNLDYTIRRIVAQASNRIFVGKELCRDRDYIENSIRYVTQVSTYGLLINLFPVWMKRAVSVIFKIPIQIAYSHCSKHLLPMFSELMGGNISISPHIFSSWLLSNSAKFPPSSPERTADFLSRRIMALNFAAIHTSTLTTCNLLLDVFSHPSSALLLRDESRASNTRWEETWNRARLNQMTRLDSALRESMRLWSLVAKAMSRKVMHPDGVVLPSGQHLPSGVTVCVSGWGLHHDQAVYPECFQFVHDRFMRSPSKEAGRKMMTTAAETDTHFAAWGIGKHACPGRFFAIDLVKIILTCILIEYDVIPLGKRPENVWFEYNVIPPPTAVLSIRKRKGFKGK